MVITEDQSFSDRGSGIPATKYYALTLTADSAHNVVWSSVSWWVEHGSRVTWEMREPSPVRALEAQMAWGYAGQDHTVVQDRASLAAFLRSGGNALVLQPVAQQWLPEVLRPVECVPTGLLTPPEPLDAIPPISLNHAPGKKLRMQILRRDDFRCRICGRRASDYTDIVLHVHHIVPFSMGGLTEAGNLITLCHTCHCGLDPHYEARLMGMTPPGAADSSSGGPYSYEEGVRLYRCLSSAGRQRTAEPGDGGSAPARTWGTEAMFQLMRDGLSDKAAELWFQMVQNTLRKVVRPHAVCRQ